MEFENNMVTICGKIVSDFEFSHEMYEEKFYRVFVSVERYSGINDVIPVMVSERMVDVKKDYKEKTVEVSGQFRSYNEHDGTKNRLILSLFAMEFKEFDGDVDASTSNQISLDGHICKEPIYRETPSGRKIADLLLAVNRQHGRSDYLPCITWGRNAIYASTFSVGEHIRISGRIQSREYMKGTEQRVAYEVSANKLERLEE